MSPRNTNHWKQKTKQKPKHNLRVFCIKWNDFCIKWKKTENDLA